jgi:hypothetical protein
MAVALPAAVPSQASLNAAAERAVALARASMIGQMDLGAAIRGVGDEDEAPALPVLVRAIHDRVRARAKVFFGENGDDDAMKFFAAAGPVCEALMAHFGVATEEATELVRGFTAAFERSYRDSGGVHFCEHYDAAAREGEPHFNEHAAFLGEAIGQGRELAGFTGRYVVLRLLTGTVLTLIYFFLIWVLEWYVGNVCKTRTAAETASDAAISAAPSFFGVWAPVRSLLGFGIKTVVKPQFYENCVGSYRTAYTNLEFYKTVEGIYLFGNVVGEVSSIVIAFMFSASSRAIAPSKQPLIEELPSPTPSPPTTPPNPRRSPRRLGPMGTKCNTCGSTAALRCAACKTTAYCSAVCQRADWIKHCADCQ